MKFTLTIEGDAAKAEDATVLARISGILNADPVTSTCIGVRLDTSETRVDRDETDTPVNGSAEVEAAPSVEPAPVPVEAEKPKRRTRKTKEPEPAKPEPAAPAALSELDDMLTDDAPAATVDDVVNALRGAIEKHGVAKARDVLAEFKAGKVADLKPEVYGAVLAKLATLGRA